ncbi:unnamed protein product [Caenorhabditis auriculariae]|uniref:Uncharacterized protein n=1 Tax=Caenorhabditis auriculariae TaxID=2777116 RepID=A0A8S1GWN0_9PELO|nr:unnamed protein product [Caenorhabditis auriculariae]
MKRLHSFLHLTPPLHADMKPNLIYRKAKMAGKTVEKYAAKKISVPKIQGEPLFGIYPVLEALQIRHRTFHKVFVKPSFRLDLAIKGKTLWRYGELNPRPLPC